MVGNAPQNNGKRVAPQLGVSADNSPTLRQVRVNVGGPNTANALRQSNTNMGKLGYNQ